MNDFYNTRAVQWMYGFFGMVGVALWAVGLSGSEGPVLARLVSFIEGAPVAAKLGMVFAHFFVLTPPGGPFFVLLNAPWWPHEDDDD